MNDFRFIGDIDSIGQRRFLGCLGRFVLVFLVGVAAMAIALKHIHGVLPRTMIGLAFGWFVFGYAASMLTDAGRKLIALVFALLPVVMTIGLFGARTLFGMADAIPLWHSFSPLMLLAGFGLGLLARRR